jgi:hypothetical protein
MTVNYISTKALLGVNKQAVNLAVLGELGMYPIFIHAFKSVIEFWLHILKSQDTLCEKSRFYAKKILFFPI